MKKHSVFLYHKSDIGRKRINRSNKGGEKGVVSNSLNRIKRKFEHYRDKDNAWGILKKAERLDEQYREKLVETANGTPALTG